MAQVEAANTEHANGYSAGKVVGFSSFKPQLVLPAYKADEAVQFYKSAFCAEELNRVNHPKRKADQDLPLIVSVELKIGASSFLVSDQTDGLIAAVDGVGAGIVFRLETEDVAGMVAKAVDAGAVADGEITEVEGTSGGGLLGKVKDPFGVVWAIASSEEKAGETDI